MVAQDDVDLTVGIRANGDLKSWSARKGFIARGVYCTTAVLCQAYDCLPAREAATEVSWPHARACLHGLSLGVRVERLFQSALL